MLCCCLPHRTVRISAQAAELGPMRLLGATDLDLLEQLFEQHPDCPFFVKDGALRYVAANGAMARLCGVKRPRDIYGMRAGELFPPELALRYEALDRWVLLRGRAVRNRLEISGRAGGTPIWLLFSRFPVLDAGGSPVGIAGVSRQLKQGDSSQPIYRRLARATERLRGQYNQPLRLDALARLAGVSKAQIERDFARLFGVTPREFLQQARLERAMHLLESDMSVAAVAYECGYSDHSAFSRRFHAMLGMSPSRYRAYLRKRAAPLAGDVS